MNGTVITAIERERSPRSAVSLIAVSGSAGEGERSTGTATRI
jgi:hypothetical protein